MPQIPGVPISEPVNQPLIDVRQVARAGSVASEVNEQSEQTAMSGLQIEGHIIDAKRQLNVKQGQIALDQLQVQLHDDLRKSVSDEQVDAALEHYRQQVPNTLAPFGKDPHAAHVLQMYADSEDTRIQDVGNVKKADIITKSDTAANNILGETYRQEAITERLAGGDGSIAEGKYELMLRSSEAHGTLLPAVADAKLMAWRQDVQVGSIEARINDPNPNQRQALIDELKTGKGPMVNGLPEGMRNQMLTAAESRNRELTSLAESQDRNSKFNNALGQFTAHPTTFSTPEAKSAAFGNPDFLKSIGSVTPNGQPDFVEGEKLRNLYAPLGADEKTAAKVKADKEFDDITKLISQNKLGEAQVMLDQSRAHFEALDANYYRAGESAIRAQVNYNESQVRFAQGEARASRAEAKFEAQEKGKQSFAALMQKVASGQPLDFQNDIAPLLMDGAITTTQVRTAMGMSALSQKDTGVTEGLRRIHNSPQFGAVTDVTNKDLGDLQYAYTKMVQEHNIRGKEAIDLADKLVNESAQKSVQDAINDAFKPAVPDDGWLARIGRSVYGLTHAPTPTSTPAPAAPNVRTYNGYQYTKGEDGQWHRGSKVQ